jgi:hypothetical protein
LNLIAPRFSDKSGLPVILDAIDGYCDVERAAEVDDRFDDRLSVAVARNRPRRVYFQDANRKASGCH